MLLDNITYTNEVKLVNTCNVNAREQISKHTCELARGMRNRKYFVSFLLAFLQSHLRLPTSLVTRSHSVSMAVADLGKGFTLNIATPIQAET